MIRSATEIKKNIKVKNAERRNNDKFESIELFEYEGNLKKKKRRKRFHFK